MTTKDMTDEIPDREGAETVPPEIETMDDESLAALDAPPTDPAEAYAWFLQRVKNPPALDKSQFGFTTTYPHLIEFMRPQLEQAGLAFLHQRRDRIGKDGRIVRIVRAAILHESGRAVVTASAILHEPPVPSKLDREAGRQALVTNDSIEAAETRAKRRLLAGLCGIAPDDNDPSLADPYEEHSRNEAIMQAQRAMLATIDTAADLKAFTEDLHASKALTAVQKSTIDGWIKSYAAERGWSSK